MDHQDLNHDERHRKILNCQRPNKCYFFDLSDNKVFVLIITIAPIILLALILLGNFGPAVRSFFAGIQ
jgi:hypothetical protein